MTGSDRPSGSDRRFLFVAFSLVALCGVAIAVFVALRIEAIEAKARLIVEDRLSSMRLVTRVQVDLDEERILLKEHVFERDLSSMTATEAKLAATQADLRRMARSYDHWSTLPAEHPRWEKIQEEVAELDVPVQRLLELSREDLYDQVRPAMMDLDRRFNGVVRDIDALVAVNDRGIADTLASMMKLRTNLLIALVGATVFELAGIALVAGFTIRIHRRYAEQAARYREQLEVQNRELDAFAGRVAHDMRDPLATISLATARLAQQQPQAVTTGVFQRGVQRMQSLIDDLLALTRVEKQVTSTVDPAAIAAQVREDFERRVEKDQGVLRVDVRPATARGSAGLLRQALGNLTENALKYRRPEVAPTIDITGSVRQDEYVLRVADNGMGMSDEEADHAFDPLYRSPRARTLPGTGLGLSIVKRVVEASGGTVFIDSRIGGGTAVEIHLPLAHAGGHGARG